MNPTYHIWQNRYRQNGRRAQNDNWLNRWRDLLPKKSLILDLGCGDGVDTHTLNTWGITPIATDGAREALTLTRQLVPKAPCLQTNFTDGIPFQNRVFSVVIASLSLHYFNTQTTQNIIHDIHRILHPKGHLIARVNALEDINHNAIPHPSKEPNLYLVNNNPKRFFNQTTLQSHFQNNWTIHNIEKLTITHYKDPKTVWEIVATKT